MFQEFPRLCRICAKPEVTNKEEFEDDGVDEAKFLEDFDANLAKGHEVPKFDNMTVSSTIAVNQDNQQTMTKPTYTKINVNMLKLVQYLHPDLKESAQKLTWERGFSEGWNAALAALAKNGDIYVESK